MPSSATKSFRQKGKIVYLKPSAVVGKSKSTIGESDSTGKCSKLARKEAVPVVFGPIPVRNPTLSVLKGDKAEGVMKSRNGGILDMNRAVSYWTEPVLD